MPTELIAHGSFLTQQTIFSDFSWDKFLYSSGVGNQAIEEYRFTCLSSFNPPSIVWTTDTSGIDTTTIISSPVTAIGKDMTVIWAESDLSLFPQTLAASLRVGMGLPPFPSISAPASSTHIPSATVIPSGETELPPKLSPAAVAGIGFGVATLALVLGFLGYFSLARRWKTKQHNAEDRSEATPPTKSKGIFGSSEWVKRWRKSAPPHPGIAEMETGDNIYKHFSGGTWRSELHGSYLRSPSLQSPSDRPHVDAHKLGAGLHSNHSRNPSDGSRVIRPIAMELEGSMPTRQAPILEVGEDIEKIKEQKLDKSKNGVMGRLGS